MALHAHKHQIGASTGIPVFGHRCPQTGDHGFVGIARLIHGTCDPQSERQRCFGFKRHIGKNIAHQRLVNEPLTEGMAVQAMMQRLHQRLATNEEYKTLFRDRVQRHFFDDGVLTAEAAQARWDSFAEHIELALAAETARWGDDKRANDPYNTRQEWATELNWFRRTYFPRRSGLVYGQLAPVSYTHLTLPTKA